MEQEFGLQVIIAAGPADAKRAIMGLAMAASAAASGTKTCVYMAMDGARCLSKENCSKVLVQGFPTVAELVAVIEEAEGVVEYCPSCLGEVCGEEVRGRVAATSACELARPGGMSIPAMRMTKVPTVVF